MTSMTAIAAFGAGLATSIHCVGMCGPLACSVVSKASNRDQAMVETTTYHLGRVLSYTTIGALAGLLGQQPLGFFFDSPALILPWLMIPFLIITAFPGKIKVPKLGFLTKPYYRAKFWAQRQPTGVSGGILGLLSPFLPCTPLYLIFGVSLLSGSLLLGAKIALCFSLGTVPLLWAVQGSARHLIKHIPHRWRSGLRSGLLLVIAIVMFVRLQGTANYFLPSAEASPQAEETELKAPTTPEETTKDLPSCCH